MVLLVDLKYHVSLFFVSIFLVNVSCLVQALINFGCAKTVFSVSGIFSSLTM